jgi:hypothetical protein
MGGWVDGWMDGWIQIKPSIHKSISHLLPLVNKTQHPPS